MCVCVCPGDVSRGGGARARECVSQGLYPGGGCRCVCVCPGGMYPGGGDACNYVAATTLRTVIKEILIHGGRAPLGSATATN